MKEIDLKHFTSRKLCQNRNTYTLSFVQLSVASHILDPKTDHKYSNKISENLLEEFSFRHLDTPKFNSSKKKSRIPFQNYESTDISNHNSKTNRNKYQPHSPSGFYLI